MGPTFRVLMLYWLLAFALLGFGAVMGVITGFQDRESAGHDSIAFLVAAFATCFAALSWKNEVTEPFQVRLARHTFFICTIITTTLLILAQVRPTLGPISLWYGGTRFRGWAVNPNQIALFVVTMPILGWYLMQQTHGHLRRAVYLAGIGVAVAVGLASGSDALRVGWLGALAATGTIFWWRSILSGHGRFVYVSYFLVPFTVIFLGALLGEDIVREVDDRFQALYGEYGQGETRLELWREGIDVISQSLIVGIGPGRPGAGPLQGGEAHNSLIDWGMATGILGILLHLGLLGWCALRALRAGSPPLFGIVMGLTAFCQFHYTLRQPVFWLMLVFVLMVTERRKVSFAQPNSVEQPPTALVKAVH